MTVRITGVIRNGMYNQIKELQKSDPVLAGELAISYFEQILTGDIESTNPVIKALVSGFDPIVKNDQKKYDKRVEAAQEAKIERMQLRELAELVNEGHMTQEQMSKRFGVAKGTISKRISLIKKEFPWLLEESVPECEEPQTESPQVWKIVDENGEERFNF